MTEPKTQALDAALAAAIAAADIAVKSKVGGLRFDFLSYAQVCAVATPALNAHGLTIYQSGTDRVEIDLNNSKSGALIVVRWAIVHDSGEMREASSIGAAGSSGDQAKALNIAVSHAHKNLLRTMFGMGGDEVVAERRESTAAAGHTGAAAARPAQVQPQAADDDKRAAVLDRVRKGIASGTLTSHQQVLEIPGKSGGTWLSEQGLATDDFTEQIRELFAPAGGGGQ